MLSVWTATDTDSLLDGHMADVTKAIVCTILFVGWCI